MAKTRATLITSLSARVLDAEAAAEAYAFEAITAIGDETRAAIKAIVTASLRDGIPPEKAARLMRAVVGLNVPQAHAVLSFAASLAELGLAPDTLNAKVQRYADKLRRARCRLIAATETLRAENAGALHAWTRAQHDGLLGPKARKRWLATADGTKAKRCDRCSQLDGVSVPISGTFPGGIATPPRHPGCRCTMTVDPGK